PMGRPPGLRGAVNRLTGDLQGARRRRDLAAASDEIAGEGDALLHAARQLGREQVGDHRLHADIGQPLDRQLLRLLAPLAGARARRPPELGQPLVAAEDDQHDDHDDHDLEHTDAHCRASLQPARVDAEAVPTVTSISRRGRAFPLLVTALVALAVAAAAADARVPVRLGTVEGFQARGTPAELNEVGIVKTGRLKAANVLVLNPGTSAGGGYFDPLARTIARRLPSWQVWSVERRENLLEDQSMVDALKAGRVDGRELFDYYLGYLSDPGVTDHYDPVADADVPFARDWGMNVEVQDLHRVVRLAGRHGRNVAMGGHSLGGTITTAYATWDFKGRAGADDLSGLVLIDGASRTTAISPEDAESALADLQTDSPWIAFGGIPAPFAGLFGTIGSALTKAEPD
ncbi:MAG: alpha/beta fold hydrolase, partial [Bauldia sp.]